MHCPHCGSQAVEKVSEGVHCIMCGREHTIEQCIAEEYRRGGRRAATKLAAPATVYKNPMVKKERAVRMLEGLPDSVRRDVLRYFSGGKE
ncbi:MAG: hypothetical protein A2Z70_01405 [Chloroflexi bacterium RBG_13_48_17]|nr:MAG: hypothetical protein A2Z70_01405 [Chloroflexi bacterium RBG_13_48_17]